MNVEDPMRPTPDQEHAYRIAYLIAGFLREDLTEDENQELDDWVTASIENQRLFEELTDPLELNQMLRWREQLQGAQVLERLKSRLDFTPERPVRSLGRWVGWGAAAALLVGIVLTIAILQQNKKGQDSQFPKLGGNDMQPGGNIATLTLSDGTAVQLDNTGAGSVARQQRVEIVKTDSGLLDYKVVQTGGEKLPEIFNTLSVPPRGQFRLNLPDGSRVWLNAASSLRYPVLFTSNQRVVYLEGEAYFEVAKDASHPFIVRSGTNNVEVLGTHFNINAYADEPLFRVTLAEGSVRVNESKVIKPREQAIVDPSGIIQTAPADLQAILAWKDGIFRFWDTPTDEVMRQIARWYNARIEYRDSIPEHFNATISRQVPLSKLLHLLQATGRVHFQIENEKIIVMK